MTALIFAVHPIHVENVSYITASFDTIGILFLLLSFYLFQLYTIKEKKLFFYISLVCAAAASFSYELTLILPFLIVLYSSFKKQKIENYIYALYFVVALFYLLVRIFFLHIPMRGEFFPNIQQKVILVPSTVTSYAVVSLFPIEVSTSTNLSSYQLKEVFNQIKNQKSLEGKNAKINTNFFLSCIFLVVLLLTAIKLFKKQSLVSFGLLWFFICLLPVGFIILESSKFSLTQPASGRYAFLSSYAPCLLLGYWFSMLIKSLGKKSKQSLLLYPKIFVLICISVLLVEYVFITRHNLNQLMDLNHQKRINAAVLEFEKYNK